MFIHLSLICESNYPALLIFNPVMLLMPRPALHKKSGQKSDPQVNKDFLVSFWLFFRTRKPYFGHQKYRHGTLFVQSRLDRSSACFTATASAMV